MKQGELCKPHCVLLRVTQQEDSSSGISMQLLDFKKSLKKTVSASMVATAFSTGADRRSSALFSFSQPLPGTSDGVLELCAGGYVCFSRHRLRARICTCLVVDVEEILQAS